MYDAKSDTISDDPGVASRVASSSKEQRVIQEQENGGAAMIVNLERATPTVDLHGQ